jgi:hypothetical protein
VIGAVSTTITYNAQTRFLVIDGIHTVTVAQDSTVIALLDRIDRIQGPPALTVVRAALLDAATVADRPVLPESTASVMARALATGRFESPLLAYLESLDQLRQFLR